VKLLRICEAGRIPITIYDKEDQILTEDETSELLVVLKSGSVAVSREGSELTKISAPGSVFGEISILVGGAHMATVTAAEECECYVIENGEDWVKHFPNLLPDLAFLLASRLKALTFYVSEVERGLNEREEKLKILNHALGGPLEAVE